MSAENAFQSWAPPEQVWSPWVKPVLFATGPATLPDVFDTEPWKNQVVPLPRSADRIALVLDLPGVAAVDVGLVAAQQGYRPVPLFNGVSGPSSVIDVSSIRHRLICDAANVRAMPIPDNAPPCFMLDRRRQGSGYQGTPGTFDNRWVVFPQDFPSARFLQGQDIRAVCLVTHKTEAPLSDLAHVLHGWQKEGLPILHLSLEVGLPAKPITVSRPSQFGSLWYRWLTLLGLRRHAGGGFGSYISMPSSGGGGFS